MNVSEKRLHGLQKNFTYRHAEFKEEIYEYLFVLRQQQLPLHLNPFARCVRRKLQRIGRSSFRKLHTHTDCAYIQYVEKRHAFASVVR